MNEHPSIPSTAARAAAALLACVLLGTGPAAAASVPASGSRIVEVTVFADRAEIVREARVDVPAGPATVEFAGIPWGVEPDSVRASARGVPATLGAVDLKAAAGEPKDTPDLVAARDEVRRLETVLAGIDAEAATEKELREFVAALRATTATRESERLGEGRADPASIQAVYALVKTSLDQIAKDALARNERRRKAQEDLEVARAKLAAARPPGAVRTKTAAVEVEAKQAGSLTLRLAYLAPGASWRPAYRASLDAATGEVSLVSEAVVTQRTGEDWTGVSLKLSTAAPARGVKPPELGSILLRPIEYVAQRARFTGLAGGMPAPAAPEPPSPGRAELKAAAMDAEAEFADEAASLREAGVVHSAYNVSFEVPGRSDVPADGTERRAVLRQESLPGKVGYRAAPAANAAAFMVAATRAPSGYPLLAGPVRVFAGGAYLGSFPLEETPPGAEVALPFGIDNRVTVERTPLPQARELTGVFGKERRIGYGFRTVVENLRDQKVAVVVEDRVPVSEDERIQVEMGKDTTPGHKEVPDRPGILEWTLDLAPKEKREILLTYTVRFPKDLIIPGLE
jgi:uncharacterized protein (TIGR02231 family)